MKNGSALNVGVFIAIPPVIANTGEWSNRLRRLALTQEIESSNLSSPAKEELYGNKGWTGV